MKREALIKYEKYRKEYATGLDHLFPPERMVDNYLSTLPDEKEEKPKIICICGSGRFLNEMHKAEEEMTLNGIIVLMIGVNTKDVARTKELAQYKPILDELHLRKIDLADGIFVINVNGYIGESTRNEINYAISQGKPVNYLEHNDIQLKNREDGK